LLEAPANVRTFWGIVAAHGGNQRGRVPLQRHRQRVNTTTKIKVK
jgi:hypothetical protein